MTDMLWALWIAGGFSALTVVVHGSKVGALASGLLGGAICVGLVVASALLTVFDLLPGFGVLACLCAVLPLVVAPARMAWMSEKARKDAELKASQIRSRARAKMRKAKPGSEPA